jgi:hypothetical protein
MRKLIYTAAMFAASITTFAQCDSFDNWSTIRIIGEIEGVWDNSYHDAKVDRDYTKMLELESYMIALHNEVCYRGEIDDSGIPYNTFGNPRKTSNELIRYYNKQAKQLKRYDK